MTTASNKVIHRKQKSITKLHKTTFASELHVAFQPKFTRSFSAEGYT